MEAPDRTDSGPMDVIGLTRNRSARLDAPLLLRVLDGTPWVTVDGQPDDWVLEPGASHRVESGRVLVFALGGAARVAVRSTTRPGVASMLDRLHRGWARALAALTPSIVGAGRAVRRAAP